MEIEIAGRVHHRSSGKRLAKAVLDHKAQREHHNKGKLFGRPFEKGHPQLSPGHLPHSVNLLDLLRDELTHIPTIEQDGFDGRGMTNAWWMIHNYVADARDGNLNVTKDIIDRLEGRPAQVISGPGGGPLEVRQSVKVISQDEIRPALETLISCGAVQICQN